MSDHEELRELLSPLAAIGVPAGQAAFTALAGAMIAGSFTWAKGGDPLPAATLTGSVVFGAGWLLALAWWQRRVDDIGRPAPAPAPEPARPYFAETTRIELIRKDAKGDSYPWGSWFEIPLPKDKIIKACAALTQGADLSMSGLGGKGRPLSRAEFCVLRDCLIGQSLAFWNNPDAHAQGCALNGAGRSFCRKWAALAGKTVKRSPTLLLQEAAWD